MLDLDYGPMWAHINCDILIWHSGYDMLSFQLRHGNKRHAPCWENLSLSSSRHTHTTICFSCCSPPNTHTRTHKHTDANHHLLPSFTKTDIKPHINFSSIFHLKHISTFTHQSLSVSVYLPISYPSCIQPAHLVTVLVKYECAQWSVVVWSAALTMSFVSGLNRKLSSHSEAQAEVHTVGCNSGNNTKQTLTLFIGTLFDPNDSWVQWKGQPGWAFAVRQAAESYRDPLPEVVEFFSELQLIP